MLKKHEFDQLLSKYKGIISMLQDGQILNLNQRELPLYNDPGVDNKYNSYWYNGYEWQPGESEIFKKQEPIIDIQDV